MRRLTLFAIVAVLASATAVAAASTSKPRQRFFISPSGNISCELDYTPGGSPTTAYCEAFKPGVSVEMTASGKLKVCHGTASCLSNPPENVTKLAYGKSVVLGPFSCTSLTSAMDCRVSATRRGFAISRSGVSALS